MEVVEGDIICQTYARMRMRVPVKLLFMLDKYSFLFILLEKLGTRVCRALLRTYHLTPSTFIHASGGRVAPGLLDLLHFLDEIA